MPNGANSSRRSAVLPYRHEQRLALDVQIGRRAAVDPDVAPGHSGRVVPRRGVAWRSHRIPLASRRLRGPSARTTSSVHTDSFPWAGHGDSLVRSLAYLGTAVLFPRVRRRRGAPGAPSPAPGAARLPGLV